jgi:hypothetical protein
MSRLLVVPAVLATVLLSACTTPLPSVTCTFEFPDASTTRVASEAGFNIFIEVVGDFTLEELPRVDFFSDIEVDSAFYADLFPDDAGTGKIMEGAVQFDAAGCASGCLAGARIATPLTPGTHRITARALAASAEVACEVDTEVRVNAPPMVTEVSIIPGNADSAQDLTVAATTSDPNGDPVTVSYRWTAPDGTESAGGSEGLLAAVNTVAGDTWMVAVTPNDGLDFGEPGTASITIDNTTPSAPDVSITPDPGRLESAITCRVTNLDAVDPDDGQDLTIEWSWTKDEVDQGIDTDTAPASGTDSGEVWACEARISDGFSTGDPGTASVTIIEPLTIPGLVQASSAGTITGTFIQQLVGDTNQLGSPGDIDGDGRAEIAITENSQSVTAGGEGPGYLHLFRGQDLTGDGPWDLTDAFLTFEGRDGFELFAPTAVGDLNGGGLDDMVIHFAHAALPGDAGNAGVYIVFGEDLVDEARGLANISLEDEAVKIIHPAHAIGTAPCAVGDLDGDGYAELALTAPEASQAQGVLYVIYGHPGTWPSEVAVTSLQPSFRVEGASAGQRMGTACAAPIDLNGDGLNDLVVSAPGAGAQGQGRILGFLNDGENSWQGTQLGSLTSDFFIDGPVNGGGFFGLSMTALGDHDGDGLDDFAVFALTYEDPDQGDSGAGGVWIISGGHPDLNGAVTFDEVASTAIEGNGNVGFCSNMTGVDINGDGLGDLVCGDLRAYSAVNLQIAPAARVFAGVVGGLGARLDFDEADLLIEPDGYVFPERCTDSTDNDLDGATDCDDLDCRRTGNNPPCSPLTCPSFSAILTCDSPVSGTTVGGSNDLVQYNETVQYSSTDNGGCNGQVLQGNDVVYSFSAPNPGLYSVTLDAASADLDVALLENDGGCGPDRCLQIASTPSNPETLSFFATATGEVFYFAVDAAAGVSDTFTITVQCAATVETEICNNGSDDDGDNAIDCDDPNCASYWTCAIVPHVCDAFINSGAVGEQAKVDDRIGASVVAVPDMNGDDFDEILIGTPAGNTPSCESGAAILIDLN